MSTNTRMDKPNVVFPYRGILFSHIEEYMILIHAATWMNLEKIMLRERRESQKTTYYMIPFI